MFPLVTIEFILLALASSGSSDLDRKELARRIKNGDHKAFKTFFDEHHAYLYNFLAGKGTPNQVAEDLVQQAFVKIWEKRNEIDPDRSLRAFLFRIAYTRMLNYFRDHSKFEQETSVSQFRTDDNPESHTQHRDLLEAVDKAVESMPEKRRMVFEFCFMQDFTYKEAAAALDVSVKTIENHMGLALKDMRAALKDFQHT